MSIKRHINRSLDVLAKEPNIRSAITFVSPNVTVKVTRQKRTRANAKQKTFLVSVGSPNFLERRLLKSGKIIRFPIVKTEAFA